MLFPIIAMNSIPPNKIVHKAFCSTDISYGRTGGDFKQSLMKSLQTNKQNYIEKKKNLMLFSTHTRSTHIQTHVSAVFGGFLSAAFAPFICSRESI